MITAKDIKIYLAGPWVKRTECGVIQKAFEDKGFTVVSRWITKHEDLGKTVEDFNTLTEAESEELTKQAIEDVLDLEGADIFIIVNSEKSEGKAFEFGYACAMRMPIIVIGDRSRNIFYQLPHVVAVKDVDECVAVLEGAIAKQNEFDAAHTPNIIVES